MDRGGGDPGGGWGSRGWVGIGIGVVGMAGV